MAGVRTEIQTALQGNLEQVAAGEFPYKTALYNIARRMVDKSVEPGEKVLVWYDKPLGEPLASQLYLASIAKGASVAVFARDLAEDAKRVAQIPLSELEHFHDQQAEVIRNSDTVLIVRAEEYPPLINELSPERAIIYQEGYKRAHLPRGKGEVKWALILYPTSYEAAQDGRLYFEYLEEVLKACDRPWEEVKLVQQKLVDKLNAGKNLTLIANEDAEDPKKRTHLTMSIDGMTFCNSTDGINNPGSEVFSAPVMDSVNGQLFAQGRHIYDGHAMRDVYLRFENGKVVEAHATEDNEGLQQVLSQGVGARFMGEVALGTNPELSGPSYTNGLLNEKIAGSFHVAIGKCYEYKVHEGVPVNVNNGNTSDRTTNHWDIAVSMKKNGKVIVDGEVIQQDGRFLDEDLAILNPR